MMLLAFSVINFSVYLPVTIGCILTHELGHVLMIKLNRQRITAVEIMPIGVNITAGERLTSYKMDIAAALGGPILNIAHAAVLVFVIKTFGYNEILVFSAVLNMAYAVLNLFPVRSLDGGRVCFLALRCFMSESRAYLVSGIISGIFLGLLGIAAFFILMVTEYNFTLVLIFGYLFYTIYMRN